jgi:hypothetical protein
MSPVPPLRPALVVNRLFMQEFLAAEAPCCALGMVEERQRLCGMLALRLDQEMPAAVTDGGFECGHALFGTTAFVVLHLVFAFPGFQTYHVLINPHNLLVQAVLRTMLDDGAYFFSLNLSLRHEVARLIVWRVVRTRPAVPSAVSYEDVRGGNDPYRALGHGTHSLLTGA